MNAAATPGGVPGRTAFVTGASTGLGRAFAGMLLAEGKRVWATSRDASRLPVLPGLTPIVLELSNGDAAEAAFLAADDAAGGFDIVINNAGYSVFGGFEATDFADWRLQLEVMLVNTAGLTHAAMRRMLSRCERDRQPRAIVNVSSLAAEFPLPFQSGYNMVKAGLSALGESLAYETRGTTLFIIDLRPGDCRTGSEAAVRRPVPAHAYEGSGERRAAMERVWAQFVRLMEEGAPPQSVAAALRRALVRGRSATVRAGPYFQAVVAPFLARFGPLALRRRIQARYFRL